MIVIVSDQDLNVASQNQTLEEIDLGSLWDRVPDREAWMVIYYGKKGGKVLKDRSGDCPRILKTHQDFLNALNSELNYVRGLE